LSDLSFRKPLFYWGFGFAYFFDPLPFAVCAEIDSMRKIFSPFGIGQLSKTNG
jgi:hypothetical protein